MQIVNKVLLYSGGMDSWLISKIYKPDLKIYVDMCSSYSKNELINIKKNKNIKIIKLDLSLYERTDKIIPLRNMYLVMLASKYGNEICIGATAGDRVLDKTYKFCNLADNLLSYLYKPQHWNPVQRNINVVIPFKKYTKSKLVQMYVKKGGNIEKAFYETFSCYNPKKNKPCWNCNLAIENG